MSITDEVLAANQQHASKFDKASLAISPRQKFSDPRLHGRAPQR